jgi:hypothetical protein
MRKLISILVVFIGVATTDGASATGYRSGLGFRLSCFERPFLSVSAHTARHGSFPHVDLRLVDPLGRTAGNGNHSSRIPNSNYGQTLEIPFHPGRSKAVALQICNATPGRYVLVVSEHGKENYYISVEGDDGREANIYERLWLHSDEDRTCQYKFRFVMRNSTVAIRWLDEDGHPLGPGQRPMCEPVLRASGQPQPYQVGTASWCGSNFEGKATASGELYHMYDMTAAHRTLPFETYIDVYQGDEPA